VEAETFEPEYDHWMKRWGTKPVKTQDDVRHDFEEHSRILGDADLTPTDRLWLKLLRATAHHVVVEDVHTYREDHKYLETGGGRKLVLADAVLIAEGEEEHTSLWAWTDGSTYVAVNRRWLSTLKMDVVGLTVVGHTLIHEACHFADSRHEHDHDQAFYERFHDASGKYLGPFVDAALKALPAVAERLGRTLDREKLRAVDRPDLAERGGRQDRGPADRPDDRRPPAVTAEETSMAATEEQKRSHEALRSGLRARGFDRCSSNGVGAGYRVRCSQCQAMCVNGVAIHERGCPNERYPAEDTDDE
jgi:hypothetical protein